MAARTGWAAANPPTEKLLAAIFATKSTTAETTTAASTCCPSSFPASVDFRGKARHAYQGERHTNDRITVTGMMMAAVSSALRDPATEINRPRIAPIGTHAAKYSPEVFQLWRTGCISGESRYRRKPPHR